MTGYASLGGGNGGLRWDWEIRGVNGKGLDLRLRLPEGFEALDPIIRGEAKTHLARGNVTINLRLARSEDTGMAEFDPSRAAVALDALKAVSADAEARGIALEPARAADILALPGILRVQEAKTEGAAEAAAADVPSLFKAFGEMRRVEGEKIGEMLIGQLSNIADEIAKARVTAEARASRAGDLLKARVATLVDATDAADAPRLQQELALLAVKADVTEEVDRLDAHVSAARTLLKKGGAIGRKLDFLMQEFNREANTLCSKSQSTDLTEIGLTLKVLIEQMREQVQNLE